MAHALPRREADRKSDERYAWPLTLVSADGVCVEASSLVRLDTALSSCHFLRTAIEAGESICLVPVARAAVLELFWQYLALTALSSPPSSPPHARHNDIVCGQDDVDQERATTTTTATTDSVDLLDWGKELSWTYGQAWSAAERAHRRHARAVSRARGGQGGQEVPIRDAVLNFIAESQPRVPRRGVLEDAQDAFPYHLPPLSCGQHNWAADTSMAPGEIGDDDVRAGDGVPASERGAVAVTHNSPRLPLSVSSTRGAQGVAATHVLPYTGDEWSTHATCAQTYADWLVPLLVPPASAEVAADASLDKHTGDTNLAAALTPAYALEDYVPDARERRFIAHLLSRSGDAHAGTTARAPLHLTWPHQKDLLELIVLAEWLGHAALYRLCVYALTSWLAQSSLDDIVASFEEERPRSETKNEDGHAATTASTDGITQSSPPALEDRSRACETATQRGRGRAQGSTAQQDRTSSHTATRHPPPHVSTSTRVSSDAMPTTCASSESAEPWASRRETMSAEERVSWMAALKGHASYLLPGLVFPSLDG